MSMPVPGTENHLKQLMHKFHNSDIFTRHLHGEDTTFEVGGRTYTLVPFGPKAGGWKLIGYYDPIESKASVFTVFVGFEDKLIHAMVDGAVISDMTIYSDIELLSCVKKSAGFILARKFEENPQVFGLMTKVANFLDKAPDISEENFTNVPMGYAVKAGILVFFRSKLDDVDYLTIQVTSPDGRIMALIHYSAALKKTPTVHVFGNRCTIDQLGVWFDDFSEVTKKDPLAEPAEPAESPILQDLFKKFENSYLWKRMTEGDLCNFGSDLGVDVIKVTEGDAVEGSDLVLDFFQLQDNKESYKIATINWRKAGDVALNTFVGEEFRPKRSLVMVLQEMIAHPRQLGNEREELADAYDDSGLDRQIHEMLESVRRTSLGQRLTHEKDVEILVAGPLSFHFNSCGTNEPGKPLFTLDVEHCSIKTALIQILEGDKASFEILEDARINFGKADLLGALMHLMQRLNEIDSGKYRAEGFGPTPTSLPNRDSKAEYDLVEDLQQEFVETNIAKRAASWNMFKIDLAEHVVILRSPNTPGQNKPCFNMIILKEKQPQMIVRWYQGGKTSLEYRDRRPESKFKRREYIQVLQELIQFAKDNEDYSEVDWKELPSTGYDMFQPLVHQPEEPLFLDLVTGDLNDVWIRWYAVTHKASLSRSVSVGLQRLEHLRELIGNTLNILKEPE